MGRTICRVLPCLFLLVSGVLCAQIPAPPATVEITLGSAAAPLYGPWKFNLGDSPIDAKTGKPLWAEAGFDDSGWETVDLKTTTDAVDLYTGVDDSVPGWTARGHAGYWGYAWYRIRVRCQPQGNQPLALAGPAAADDVYQVFMDGELVGSFGNFTSKRPMVYASHPLMFRLEPGHDLTATRVLAFRFWMDPSTIVNDPTAGGMRTAPVLGGAGVVALDYQSRWVEVIKLNLARIITGLAFVLLATMAFSLILFDPSDATYFWIGLLFLATAAYRAVDVGSITELYPYLATSLIMSVDAALAYALWVIVWWVWFGRVGFRWLPRAVIVLAVVLTISMVLGYEVFFAVVSHTVALGFYALARVVQFLLFGMLVWVVVDATRRHRFDGWLVLPVVILRGVSSFNQDLQRLHIRLSWFPFGIEVSLTSIVDLLIVGVIALLLLRRLQESVKRQKEMALDVKQAQEVQQVILPEHRIMLPGFEIESEYRPAREVGGDFFQIIPHASDDSVLIVAGDLEGKGLKAGMLVALLVGAIRTASQFSLDPVVMLAELNRRLLGRSDARATCMALRIARDGSATLANAGHLPPYLNGVPIEIEGSLPLGMIENLDCSVVDFQLSASDRLLLVSDGVPEATDDRGELFGFERVLELVGRQHTAAGIAEAAQAFGQEDDISVISVTRVPVAELAAEPALA